MKKSRFSEEQMVGMLREADRTPVEAVAKAHGVSEQTLYAWRQRFGGMGSSDVKRLRQLEQENTRLRKLLADRDLEIEVMKEFSSYDWQHFLKGHNLVASQSRRGNCHDNAVAERFFQLMKRERIRRRIYIDREEARRDVFDYIEMFYNPTRRRGYNNSLSPVEFESSISAGSKVSSAGGAIHPGGTLAKKLHSNMRFFRTSNTNYDMLVTIKLKVVQ